jgi:peptidyl-prolyl cis-trans isomerase C
MAMLEEPGRGAHGYHMLRAALDTYQRNLAELGPDELAEVRRIADKSYEIESLVVESEEARDILITAEEVERAFEAIASRYTDRGELAEDLQHNGLDEELLRASLRRELLFDAVMQRVGARTVEVGELDILLYYEMNRDRFSFSEKRTARHILITVNPSYPDNTPETALARIEELAERLQMRPNRFASLARRHSECPSAMEGGKLGTLTRGQLYPELDAVLFGLDAGQVSDVVESELGFHVLLCERIEPAGQIPITKAREGIRQLLEKRKRRNCQKAWLGQLRRASDTRRLS